MAIQETASYKEKATRRYKIKAKNGELKNARGYGRAIALFTVNLKRIVKLQV